MYQFQNSPEGFDAVRKRLVKISIALNLIMILFTTAILYCSADGASVSIWVNLVIVAFLVTILTYGSMKAISRQKEIYESYRLIIAPDNLSREQKGTPKLTLPFDQITSITQAKNGSLLIKGQKYGEFIFVSADIENYGEVKASLQQIMEPAPHESNNILNKYPYLLPLLTIVLMATIYLSNNKIAVGASGVFLVLLMGWSFFKLLANKQLDSKMRRALWYIPIVLLCIMAVVYYKVFVK